MLLWLEEAAIEIAMILATATGLVMLVAAVWYHLGRHLSQGAHRDVRFSAEPASQPSAASPATPHRPSGHHA